MDERTTSAAVLGFFLGALVLGFLMSVISKSAWEYNTALRGCAQYDQKTGQWGWKE